MEQPNCIRVEDPTVPEGLPDFTHDQLGLIEAVRKKYKGEFQDNSIPSANFLNGGNYGFIVPENEERAKLYAQRNSELAKAGIGYDPVQGRVKKISFLKLPPNEYVGRIGNFLVGINSKPPTVDSFMLFPLHACRDGGFCEYPQDLSCVTPEMINDINEITRYGHISVFFNGTVNSASSMHFCAMSNWCEMEDGSYKELPLAQAIWRGEGDGYDLNGVNMYFPPDDPRSIRLHGLVMKTAEEACYCINRISPQGIRSDLFNSLSTTVLRPTRNDCNLVTYLPDGTPWLPSLEAAGFCLKTPGFDDLCGECSHDDIIRGMYHAFNSKVYTNAEIREIAGIDVPLELAMYQQPSMEYAEI